MKAYKLTGTVDRDGKLIITEPTNLAPGDVEVIVLQSDKIIKDPKLSSNEQSSKRPSKVKTFQDWFAKTEPATSALNLDDTKWNYLKEKHNL